MNNTFIYLKDIKERNKETYTWVIFQFQKSYGDLINWTLKCIRIDRSERSNWTGSDDERTEPREAWQHLDDSFRFVSISGARQANGFWLHLISLLTSLVRRMYRVVRYRVYAKLIAKCCDLVSRGKKTVTCCLVASFLCRHYWEIWYKHEAIFWNHDCGPYLLFICAIISPLSSVSSVNRPTDYTQHHQLLTT